MARNERLQFKNNVAYDKVTKRWHVRKMILGRVVQRGFVTKRSAMMFLDGLVLDAAANAYGLRLDDSPQTLADAFEEYISDRQLFGRTDKTIYDYETKGKAIFKHLGESHPVTLRKKDVIHYVKERQTDGAGNRRILNELKLLRTVLKHTVGEAVLTWQLPDLSLEVIDKSIPTDNEIKEMYFATERADVRTAISLAVLTGIRAGDVFRACDEWREGDVLAVPMAKRRGIINRIPIVETLAEHLDSATGDTYVGSTKNAVKMALQRATNGKWSGVGHLRHVCSTWAAQGGFDDDDIDLLLGHAGRTVARRHYIADEGVERKRTALASVEKRFRKALGL